MKSFFIFIAGVITGAVLLIVAGVLINNSTSSVDLVDDGITMFSETGDCVSTNKFKVIQVHDSGNALAIEQEKMTYSDNYMMGDIVVLFLSNGEKHYYDDQMIDIPKGKCAKQIGTYKYSTRESIYKTVPIVEILPK
ncbi:MAG: hypothetical protein SNI70_12655 [Rikenellaceae bacterium]